VLSAEVFDDSTGNRCAKYAAAASNRLYRAHDLRLTGAFQQVAASARSQGCKDRLIVGKHGQYQNRSMWTSTSDAAGGLDTANARHMEVHDHHIWMELQTERDRPPSIGRLTDHIEARGIQRRPETVTVKGVIIGDQYA
jgi:hypothetical protein